MPVYGMSKGSELYGRSEPEIWPVIVLVQTFILLLTVDRIWTQISTPEGQQIPVSSTHHYVNIVGPRAYILALSTCD